MKLTKRNICIVFFGLFFYGSIQASITTDNTNDNDHQAGAVTKPPPQHESNSTADHSKFKELKGPFESGPAVTQACLECHTEAGHQFMQNVH